MNIETEYAQKIHDMCCQERNRRIIEAVRTNDRLESIQPGITQYTNFR